MNCVGLRIRHVTREWPILMLWSPCGTQQEMVDSGMAVAARLCTGAPSVDESTASGSFFERVTELNPGEMRAETEVVWPGRGGHYRAPRE